MVIISSVNNYSPDELRCFVGSLNNVGYSGKKIMIMHHDYTNTMDYLKENGWEIHKIDLYMLQHIQRYKESHIILDEYEDESVLFLDCRDVYFHKNPELWDINSSLYVGVDGFLKLNDHPWGRENMSKSYPDHYSNLSEEIHLNCGVIFGKCPIISDFLLDVYEMALKSKQRININPMDFTPDDQMALNVLSYTKYRDKLTIQNENDDFIINLAQTKWDGKKEYYLYHQYDRVQNFHLKKLC